MDPWADFNDRQRGYGGNPTISCYKCRGPHLAKDCQVKKPKRPVPTAGPDAPGPFVLDPRDFVPVMAGDQIGRRYPFDPNGHHVFSVAEVADMKRNSRPG